MASRQLRKLRKQQELLSPQTEAGAAAGSDESDHEPAPAKPRANVFSGFAALGGLGGDEEDDDQISEEDVASPQMTADTNQGPASGQVDEQAPPKKSKKPKKKKKKGKKPESLAPAKEENESVDEIDRVLEELKLEKPAQTASTSSASTAAAASTTQLCDLLGVSFHHLKAANEMRKLFGKSMEAASSEDSPRPARPRGGQREVDLETFLAAQPAMPGQPGKTSMFDTVLRTNPFIEGKKTWPRDSTHGLKMIRIGDADDVGAVEFAFSHDDNYEALDVAFFGLVGMYDPMQIVYFLNRYPYHISSLIQVSKVAKQDQNSALAADLIERALFTFGRVGLSDFRKKLEQGRVKMDFARPENRQFFLAGSNQVRNLVLKGTFRTALEWAKLFLAINHDDPYGMINWVHVLAIRAYEARWFVQLCGSKIFDEMSGVANSVYAKQTLALAQLQLKDRAGARATLTAEIERLPWLYCALFTALGLDTPKSIWAVQPRNKDEELHTKLYIHMAKDLWSGPEAVSLLVEAADAARNTDPKSLPPGPNVSLATARFIYLDNTPELMSAVPREMLHTSPNFDFDPLPPPKDENIFSSSSQERPWALTGRDLLRAVMGNRMMATPGNQQDGPGMADLPGWPEAAWPVDDNSDLSISVGSDDGGGDDDRDADDNEDVVVRTVPRDGFMQRAVETLMANIFGGGARENDDGNEDEDDAMAPLSMPGAWFDPEEHGGADREGGDGEHRT
ncbi:transcriptional repressor TCF25-domain-containing protein [Lasiosphaeria ovina]|uniref:Transcriptional repressor TCF25-domain-containing protein n=1 Tax=Lasiosphaeria ovina TaxID=92902 RepID=A0AAE0K803_9PEZI|nr:transcriptional repressor TCF25-domain-containing protein [Lasiosphaeria ovina]